MSLVRIQRTKLQLNELTEPSSWIIFITTWESICNFTNLNLKFEAYFNPFKKDLDINRNFVVLSCQHILFRTFARTLFRPSNVCDISNKIEIDRLKKNVEPGKKSSEQIQKIIIMI
jgi:hypothetical protein